ncbi:hypothetical protein GIB67_035522 [Kingdonia uniflora]|uniref:Small-subunit processome Utp12 domain-containing protein n=1 Tax=Kingdonia uniflora TaxID=39325 RepID=A0A7J7MCF2_9MAGN|nr:hypothetical protein GIB67_035522 [Kingdonia uniflora]
MGMPNIRDLLTSFSPTSEFFAISSGDGRIKIWDTSKGQLQTEFADITSTNDTDFYAKSESGHLSLDYTCMKWLPLGRKRKRKAGVSLLLLGTGSGDVLALDVSSGQLKWRANDCHPGGVNAISFSTKSSCIYTAGVDGFVCQIDWTTGSLLGKFKASTKAVSSMALSSDGKILATAAARLKIFKCSDNKMIQKFSGHPGAVRCMIFSEDGNYVLSSSVGERYIAVWNVDSSKKQSASCVLSMEHPAVFLHCRCKDNEGTKEIGLYVLAISEIGHCYFWYGKNVEDLGNSKSTRITFSSEAHLSMNQKSMLPMIFAAEIQAIVKSGSGQVFVAHGSLIKPSFEKVVVQCGVDIILNSSPDGILLPKGSQLHTSRKNQLLRTEVTALDRANAEDALLPIPRIYDSQDKKKRHQQSDMDSDDMMIDDPKINRIESKPMDTEDGQEKFEKHAVSICMEDRLRSLGVLTNDDDIIKESFQRVPNNMIPSSTMFTEALFEAILSQKKIKAAILSITSSDAYKLLKVLVAMWKSSCHIGFAMYNKDHIASRAIMIEMMCVNRSGSGKQVLPWICSILVNHSRYIISQEPTNQMLNSLHKVNCYTTHILFFRNKANTRTPCPQSRQFSIIL